MPKTKPVKKKSSKAIEIEKKQEQSKKELNDMLNSGYEHFDGAKDITLLAEQLEDSEVSSHVVARIASVIGVSLVVKQNGQTGEIYDIRTLHGGILE